MQKLTCCELISFSLLVLIIGAGSDVRADEFDQAGAERIGVLTQNICALYNPGDKLSDVVFTDDSKRFAYAMRQSRAESIQ